MDSVSWMLCVRLLVAALLGGLIGLEREYRAKEAGLKTHFLVALGSALFMLVSQFGVSDALSSLLLQHGDSFPVRADISRIASQIVTGIGFLGAGTIVLHKRFVVGLTTAATIWTTAAIGIAVGGGLFAVATIAALVTIAGLELFMLVERRIGSARHELQVTMWAEDKKAVSAAVSSLTAMRGVTLNSYLVARHGKSGLNVTVVLAAPVRTVTPASILARLNEIPGIETETVE